MLRLTVAGLLFVLLFAGAAQSAGPRFAFSVNDLDASLASYRIDPDSGQLRFLRYYPLSKSTPAVEVDPSGQFVLATSQAVDRVFVFRLDRQTGELKEVPGSPFVTGGRAPFQIVFHPNGRFLYMTHRFAGVGAYAFNVQSGAVTPLADSPYPAGLRPRAIVLTPSGRHLYALNAHDNTLSGYRVDAQNGKLTPLAGFPRAISEVAGIDYLGQELQDIPDTAGGLPYHMTRDPAGRYLFVLNAAAANINVYAIDDASGALQEVAASPFATGFNPYSATVDPSGQRLYVVLSRDDSIAVHDIDVDTGRLTPLPGSPFSSGGDIPARILFAPDGRRAYVCNMASNDIAQMRVDMRSGALSVVEVVKTRSAPWALALAGGEPAPVSQTSFYAARQRGQKGELALLSSALKPLVRAPSDGRPVAVLPRAGGSHVYVANADTHSITAFRRDADSGGLQAFADVPAGRNPLAIASDVNGWYLYVANHDDDTLSTYFLEDDTGEPKAVRGSPVSTGKRPVAVTIDPASRYAFVVNQGSNNISVYRYRNNVTPLYFESVRYGSPFAAGEAPADLAVDPSGRYAYVANSGSDDISAYRIHHETGALSALPGSPFAAGRHPLGLSVHPNGRFLYVISRDSADLATYRIETALGAIALQGKPLKLPLTPKRLWLSASGEEAYVLSADGKRLLHLALDAQSGEPRLRSSTRLSSPVLDLAPVPSP